MLPGILQDVASEDQAAFPNICAPLLNQRSHTTISVFTRTSTTPGESSLAAANGLAMAPLMSQTTNMPLFVLVLSMIEFVVDLLMRIGMQA